MSGHGWHTGGGGEDGFGLPPDDPVPSSSSQIYCVDCGCYVSNYIGCVELGHLVPAFRFLCDPIPPSRPLDIGTEIEQSGVPTGYTEDLMATYSTSNSDTQFSQLFDTGSSITGSMGMHPAALGLTYGQHQGEASNEYGFPIMPVPNQFNSGILQQLVPYQPPQQQFGIYPDPDSMQIDSFSDAAGRPATTENRLDESSQNNRGTFEIYRQRWASQGHYPTNAELMSIATLEGLPLDVVRLWFETHLPSPSMLMTNSAGSSSAIQAPSGKGKGKQRQGSMRSKTNTSKTVEDVKHWAKDKFWEDCRKHQARRSASDSPYKCTGCSDCRYSTSERDAWQRHEQIWQPQEFWHCVICRAERKKPCICSRKDKLLDHLFSAHGVVDRTQAEGLRDDSKVAIDAGFEVRCKFVDRFGRQCLCTFDSWEARIRHYLAHFNDQIADGPWQLCPRRDRWFDDEEDDTQGGTSFSGSSSGQWTGHSGQSTSSGVSVSSKNQQHHGSSGNNTGSYQYAAGDQCGAAIQDNQLHSATADLASPSLNGVRAAVCSTSHATKPTQLIDVLRLYLVTPPDDAKYLALDHTWTKVTSTTPQAASMRQIGSSLQLEHCPVPLDEAITFTKDLGYRFLWIAQICEPRRCDLALRTILQRASLTMVPVQTAELKAQTVFFACRFSAIQKVHAWAHLDISHVRNLGHGAFGIVDEVKLRSSNQSFARKELCATDIRTKVGDFELKEIEIMQKLQHPHIAQIGGAYYEPGRQTWNILMTPVADCTLRDYLANPGRWTDKGDNIPRWFVCLTAAVKYLHGQSCRHKDIKPANILISGRDVLLTDFGTSYDFSSDDDLMSEISATQGRTLSTPRYCAPEVAAEERRGRKADIFSLGCVFVEMLTSALDMSMKEMQRFVFGAKRGWHATYHHNLTRLKKWLVQLKRATTIPWYQQLAVICMRMTSHNADDRPSATDILDELLTFIRSSGQCFNGLCACLQHRAVQSPTARMRLAKSAKRRKQYALKKTPNGGPSTMTLPIASTYPLAHSAGYSFFGKLDLSFAALGVTMSTDGTIIDIWLTYAVLPTTCCASGAATSKARVEFVRERCTILVQDDFDEKRNITTDGHAASICGQVRPRQPTAVLDSNGLCKTFATGVNGSWTASTQQGDADCLRYTRYGPGSKRRPDHWRKTYRKVLSALRWTLSRRQSVATVGSAVATGAESAIVTANSDLWALGTSVWSSFLDADILGIILWLAAYEISTGLKQNVCVTAVVLAFTKINYIDYAQQKKQAQTCNCGCRCSAAATAVVDDIVESKSGMSKGGLNEDTQLADEDNTSPVRMDDYDPALTIRDSTHSSENCLESDACAMGSSAEDKTKDGPMIEVGDLGKISMDVLLEAFQKYRRCTCHSQAVRVEEIASESSTFSPTTVTETRPLSEAGCSGADFRAACDAGQSFAGEEEGNTWEFGFYDMW